MTLDNAFYSSLKRDADLIAWEGFLATSGQCYTGITESVCETPTNPEMGVVYSVEELDLTKPSEWTPIESSWGWQNPNPDLEKSIVCAKNLALRFDSSSQFRVRSSEGQVKAGPFWVEKRFLTDGVPVKMPPGYECPFLDRALSGIDAHPDRDWNGTLP